MAQQYRGSGGPPRFTRPGNRFNTPYNRNAQRNNFNEMRPAWIRPGLNTTKSTSESSSPTVSTSINNPTDSSHDGTRVPSTEKQPNEPSSSSSFESNETKPVDPSSSTTQKRPYPEADSQAASSSSESASNFSSQPLNAERKVTQGGRCRLFIGNIPTDLTQDEFLLFFNKYGELVEYFVNPSRGFGFVKLSSRHLAEQAKYDLDGHVLRGKPLRIRFASQGATIKVKNLSPNVSNELLKEAFEQYFGSVERAVVIVDDRGKSTGEGIIEFEKKPSAQKCLNDCTERCFYLTRELRPVIVEPWDIKDEEDGLPEKSLMRNAVYTKERDMKPRFAELNSIEQTIGLKWKELELQEKQLLEEVKRRMQYATEQLQAEIDQMYLDHQSQMIREDLMRRQEELRRIDELRSQEFDRRRQMMPMRPPESYNDPFNHPNVPVNTLYHSNAAAAAAAAPPFSHLANEGNYPTNQMTRNYDYPPAGFDRKRTRY